MLDSSILIAPLVFFITPNDPRFVNTMDRILLPPEKGGLTSTGLVYRYDTELSDDGRPLALFLTSTTTRIPAANKKLCRRGRPRRSLLYVHFLACGSHN